ncbi:hypothetical protein B0H65DRAFT_512269 [Neurospora tetraspora]|uniref:Uncharacterized protein n=1 Tax=Neurospora tetraspora TaxID=94610 RepID=A0AAE0J8G2_9PEZI|nr:hypothetical protein B0H65DRAFT_512269 [Neurospora tetraspora]
MDCNDGLATMVVMMVMVIWPAQEVAPWSHLVAQFVSLGICDGTNEFIANPCHPLRPPCSCSPACLSEFLQSGRCSGRKEAGERAVSVQPGGCFTGDDWLGVKLDQDVTRCYADINAVSSSVSRDGPEYHPGLAVCLLVALSARIMKFHRAYRHIVWAVRHKQLLPQHMPAYLLELLGLSRTEKPLPGWFPEVPGHLQQNGTSRYIAVTAGTTPRFDGIKSFGTSWAPKWVGKQTVYPMAVLSLVTAECDKLS